MSRCTNKPNGSAAIPIPSWRHVDGHKIPVDTGFIVYNRATYPNLSALFDHLGVATQLSDMSLAVSLGGGDLEYSGTGLRGLFAQPAQPVSARASGRCSAISPKFYRQAPLDADSV